ncbi:MULTISPECIES: trypsin-like peptidase domain-containing protein [Allobaculum]|uniref:trypsin-like peptidase domain-containing protein n=1 Tax=Allobaculum TaxID=174708 RepID=UPI001E39A2FB|nr:MULTISPECIES: trypsin-like peptidase domain-containing protein [Allobaculum]UNT93449.1 trypsin-like peptidase domain-containing protein [Allobaculum sp. Allo2]
MKRKHIYPIPPAYGSTRPKLGHRLGAWVLSLTMAFSFLSPTAMLAKEKPDFTDAPNGTVTVEDDSVRYAFDSTQIQNDAASEEEAEPENEQPLDPVYKEDPSGPDGSDILPEYNEDSPETRTRVMDTTRMPYSAICKLRLEFVDQNDEHRYYVGTGFVIGPNTVLTCGHCIYDVEHGYGWIQSIHITPGATDYSAPFGAWTSEDVEYFEVDKGWLNDAHEANDVALIVLNDDIAAKTGKLPLSIDGAKAQRLHLSGYPAEYNHENDISTQYESWGSDVEVFDRILESNTYGSGGQSGSPMLNENGEVVSLFAYVYVYRDRSGGPLMDRERLVWIAQNSRVPDPVFRLYNPNSGEHFYTLNLQEANYLDRAGWNAEGLAWSSCDEDNAIPVFRLYNPNTGDHHYTIDEKEYNALQGFGWRAEGESWKAALEHYEHPVYRLYNPNAETGSHHFTLSEDERDNLIYYGWKYEGIAFYAD